MALLDDPHPRVRFTAALALDGQPAAGKTAALGRMLRHDVSHAWTRRAVALAVDDDAADMLALARQAAGGADEAAWREAVRGLAFTASSAAGRQDRLDHLLDQIEPRAAPHAVEPLIAAWPRLGPSIRPQVVGLLVSDRRHHAALLGGIEAGAVSLGELNLDLEQRRALLNRTKPDLAARAARLLGDEEYANRRPLVAEWLIRMPAEGDSNEGRAVFEERCGACHVAHGIGHRVGPDLEALAHRSVEDLVSHVLDPKLAINPGYVSCVIEQEDGRSVTGLLAIDGADAVTLLQPEAKRVTVPRAEIADLRMPSTSLMPEGLEHVLTPAQLRAVIAFIQAR